MTEPESNNLAIEEMVRHTDRRFFEEFDPFGHFVVADAMRGKTPGSFRLTDKETGQEVLDATVIERLHASQKQLQDHISFSIRALRYFTSETLMLLLLNSAAREPFSRTTSVLQGNRLTAIFAQLSERKVPEGFELAGSDLSFEEWVYQSIFRSAAETGDAIDNEVAEMLVEEAKLLSVRGAINAYKHGKSTSFGTGPVAQMETDEGYKAINVRLRGINWVDWKEKPKDKEYSVGFGTEELDPEADYRRILSCSLLLDCVKQVRLAELNDQTQFNVTMPSDIALGAFPKRQYFNIKIMPGAKQ